MRRLIVLASLLFATPGVAQNGLYSPASLPPEQAVSPMVVRGLLMARDSIFHLDSITVLQVAPSPAYDSLWVAFEACSGIQLADSVRASWTISLAPGDGFIVPGGKEPVPGYAFVERRNIVVLVKYAKHRQLLGHEMVHALIWQDRQTTGHNERGDMPEFARCGVQNQ